MTALLIASLFAAVTPATSALADPPAGPDDGSAIGGGASSPLEEYIDGTIINKGNSTLTVDGVSDNACVTMPGVVSPADIPEQYRAAPPAGQGKWEYQVCADSGAHAQTVVNRHPSVEAAKAYCTIGQNEEPPASQIPCAVFAYWRPQINTPPPAPDESRDNYFESFFQFSPDLGTSPHNGALGLIANLPTWVWNKVVTTFPKAVGDLGLFGGLAATAWHLNTTLDTNDTNGRICSISGLRMVGKVWDDGMNPAAASPDCGHTYHNMGIYNIHGCSRWLIIAVGPFFAIVFPITVCSDTTMTVKESQVLTGGDAHRGPVR